MKNTIEELEKMLTVLALESASLLVKVKRINGKQIIVKIISEVYMYFFLIEKNSFLKAYIRIAIRRGTKTFSL